MLCICAETCADTYVFSKGLSQNFQLKVGGQEKNLILVKIIVKFSAAETHAKFFIVIAEKKNPFLTFSEKKKQQPRSIIINLFDKFLL